MKIASMLFNPIGIPVGMLEKLGKDNAGFKALHRLVQSRQTNAQRRAILRAEQIATLNQKGKK